MRDDEGPLSKEAIPEWIAIITGLVIMWAFVFIMSPTGKELIQQWMR